MASNLFLLALVVTSMTSGCILSPEIEEEPAETLFPPEILLDTIFPPDTASIIDLDIACSPAVFRVGTVRDLNRRDYLYARWLEDWRADQYRSIWQNAFIPPVPNSAERPGVETALVISGYSVGSVHTMRFFLADRPPRTDGNGMEMPPDSEGQTTWVQWTFKLVPEGSGICALEPQP